MNVYISTCNKNLNLVQPFAFLFNKFWSDEINVFVLGYEKPSFKLPKNFNFISIGVNDNVGNWSTDLKNYFESIDDKYFYFTLEDMWLVDYVDIPTINKFEKFIKQDKVGRINVTRDTCTRPNIHYDYIDDKEIVEANQNAEYRISTWWSLWDKDYLLKYLTPGLTPWQFEIKGSLRAMNDGHHILCMKGNRPPDNACLSNCNAVWRGDRKRFNVHNSNYEDNRHYLSENVIKEMKQNKVVENNHKFGVVFQKNWKMLNV